MTEEDYIRKAVELADGWHLITGLADTDIVESLSGYRGSILSTPELQDALAAQLVRQADAKPFELAVDIDINRAKVLRFQDAEPIDHWVQISCHSGPDRTMNTINAIVDSKVLERNPHD